MSWWHPALLGPLPEPGSGGGPELVVAGRVVAKRVCAATSFVDVDGLAVAVAATDSELFAPPEGRPAPGVIQVWLRGLP